MLMNVWERIRRRLDLSFDVDGLERGVLRIFPESIIRFHLHVVVLLLEELVSAMIQDKLSSFAFGLERKLFGDEP